MPGGPSLRRFGINLRPSSSGRGYGHAPRHVIAYDDGEVRQQCSVCFTTRMLGGELATSSETSEVGFVPLERLDELNIHPSMRLRIDHWREHRPEPYIG